MRHLLVGSLALLALVALDTLPLPTGRGGGGRVQADEKGPIVINPETKARRGLYPIAIPYPVDGDAASAQIITEVQAFDLGVSSWFKVLDPKSFLADLRREGMAIEPRQWQDVGAFGVIKARAMIAGGQATLEFKLYEVDKGAVPVMEKRYISPVADVRRMTHRWCNDVVQYYTGEPGFFGSQITFSTGKRIMVMDFDGNAAYAVTKNESINILPAFSPSGGQVAFTSYMRGNPDLYIVATGGGRPRRVSFYNGMNTGASWSPDGSKVAVTLSKDGNAELYVVSAADGKVLSRLTNNRYIDTSPAWSPDGGEIAFVSNREGSPQIFVMRADGSNQRRVSTVGTYNQTPSWCPRKGERVLAYTARDDASGRNDIVTLDLGTGKMVRITQNQGNNSEPTWSPNGRVLAFASQRGSGSGIYLANADGTGEQKLVFKGGGESPDWGPTPK
jgi:TolB protein